MELNYSRQEFAKKIKGNTLGNLLEWKEDLVDAFLTWNKKWVDYLLAESIWEQCRIIHMKIDHIVWLGEWLEQANFVNESRLEERVFEIPDDLQKLPEWFVKINLIVMYFFAVNKYSAEKWLDINSFELDSFWFGEIPDILSFSIIQDIEFEWWHKALRVYWKDIPFSWFFISIVPKNK